MTERFLTLPEIHRAAKRLLPPGVYGYGAGGAETETTLRRNRHALQQLAIRQRVSTALCKFCEKNWRQVWGCADRRACGD